MSVEGKDNVAAPPEEKHPEQVPWTQYVGTKESLGKKITEAEEKVKSLEEKLKASPSVDEHSKLKQELEETKKKAAEVEAKLKERTEKSVSELKDTLLNRGIPKEKVDKMSETEMRTVMDVLGDKRPAPDLGSGRGSGELKGSPMDLAKQAYESSKAKK